MSRRSWITVAAAGLVICAAFAGGPGLLDEGGLYSLIGAEPIPPPCNGTYCSYPDCPSMPGKTCPYTYQQCWPGTYDHFLYLSNGTLGVCYDLGVNCVSRSEDLITPDDCFPH